MSLLLILPLSAAWAAHEAHGGGGVILDPKQLVSGQETAGSIEIFDKLDYDQEFLIQDQDEYRAYIAPKLDILKTKLPRTAHFLEQVFIRGINPRWYFVRFALRRIDDASESSHLYLTYRRVQVAANDGVKVQIQQTFWNALEPRSRALLLMHEALRSAIGIDFYQTSDIVSSIGSLLLNQNLNTFGAGAIAAELLQTLEPCTKDGKSSVLRDLVFADSHLVQKTAGGWEDLSVLEDGITPTSCISETDRCAFRDLQTGILWSMASPDKTTDGNLNYEQAARSCARITGFAGFYSWKLPTFLELTDVTRRFPDLVKNFPAFGNANNAFWSRTTPFEDPWSTVISLDRGVALKGWTINLATGQRREISRSAEIPYVCVVDERQGWIDVSTDQTGKVSKSCALPADQCSFQDTRTGLTWTKPGPNYRWRYRGRRRTEDLGFVSREVAASICDSLNWNGETGWRLPSRRETAEAKRDGLTGIVLGHEVFGNLSAPFWVDTGEDDNQPTVLFTSADAVSNVSATARYLCVHDAAE